MKKYIKFILIGLVVLIVVILAPSFISGFKSSYNPGGAIKMAEKKVVEDKDIYTPKGYILTTKAEVRETDYGQIILTRMESGKNTILIMKGDKDNIECKGQRISFGVITVCKFDFGVSQADPNAKILKFDKGNNTFQVQISDKNLSDVEITQLIESL
jgi:hypothetical protein